MNEFSEQLNSADGRQWLAMQYVLTELSEDDRAAFEDAMMDDPGLCETVVEALRLSAGIALACEPDRIDVLPAMAQRKKSPAAKFGVLVACASLLLLMAVAWRPVPRDTGTHLSSAEDAADAAALVGLLQHQLPAGLYSDGEMEMVTDDSLADLMAPEWLLTAVDLDETPADDEDELPADRSIVF